MSININNLNRSQLGALVKKVEARQKDLAKEELAHARKQVVSIAKQTGFSLDELIGNSPRPTSKVKFRNPSDPTQTWSGRGKHPKWFNQALKAGKTQQDLLAA